MVSCSLCSRDAVYTSRTDGRSYCRAHFIKHFEKKVRRTMRRYRMFSKREDIVVAVSGGKDSLSALFFMLKLARKNPNWSVRALLIDEGIKGYRDITMKDFLEFSRKYSVDYEILSFREEFGITLDEMARDTEYTPCTYCGVLRRYLLNKGAREMGATVLVTAHNLDDMAQTALINIMRNEPKRLVRLSPVTGVVQNKSFVKKVKIFYDVYERETVVYSWINGFFPSFVECPYVERGMRAEVRRKLNELEEKYPGTKHAIVNFLKDIIPPLGKYFAGTPSVCSVCGEPTSGAVCRVCSILERFKNKEGGFRL